MGVFHLTKWYLDCVSDSGQAVILYAARVRSRGIPFILTSILTYEDGRIESRTRFGFRWHPPVENNGVVTWDCNKFGTSGRWQTQSASIKRLLYRDGPNEVTWNCIQPDSAVTVRTGARTFSGRGYAECLEMFGVPASIGIQSLRWGRFVSGNESIIWIEWQGDHPQSLLLHNGCEQSGLIGDNQIVSPSHFTLRLSDSQALREGKVGQTALRSIPLARLILPKSLNSLREEKWLSKGTLERPDYKVVTGWVIHERVHFES